MITKIVYVLVCSKDDYFAEMLRLSLYSLRLYHPEVSVEVLMDEDSFFRLEKQMSPLLTEAKPIIVRIPNEYSLMQRSRYLKTRLRDLISGDFLYLDTDTVIGGSLEAVDTFPWDVAAVLDNHDGTLSDAQLNTEPDNWSVLFPDKQFNSGVLYVKETLVSHRLFHQWHENWKYSVSKNCYYDQPALRKAISDTDIRIHELRGQWNCQVNRPSSIDYQKDALVFHYQRAGFYVSRICRDIKKRRHVDGQAASLAESPHQYFSGQLCYMTQMEFSSLDALRETQYDYPDFFLSLTKEARLYRRIVSSLSGLKHKVLNLMKR